MSFDVASVPHLLEPPEHDIDRLERRIEPRRYVVERRRRIRRLEDQRTANGLRPRRAGLVGRRHDDVAIARSVAFPSRAVAENRLIDASHLGDGSCCHGRILIETNKRLSRSRLVGPVHDGSPYLPLPDSQCVPAGGVIITFYDIKDTWRILVRIRLPRCAIWSLNADLTRTRGTEAERGARVLIRSPGSEPSYPLPLYRLADERNTVSRLAV